VGGAHEAWRHPVTVWALVFGFAALAHVVFEREVMAQAYGRQVSEKSERRASRRSLLTVAMAGTARASAALSVTLICFALFIFAYTGAPGVRAPTTA
jgi:hypothetical protein